MQDLGQPDPKFLNKLGEYVAQNPKTHTSTVLLHLPPSICIVSLTRTSSPNEEKKKPVFSDGYLHYVPTKQKYMLKHHSPLTELHPTRQKVKEHIWLSTVPCSLMGM